MNPWVPEPLEWQRQFFDKLRRALAVGHLLFMLNVGRQAGKSRGLLLWSLLWERGVFSGGNIAICAPSKNHIDDLRDQVEKWCSETISGLSPAGLGFEFLTGGRLDFWTLGTGAVAPLRGRAYDAVVIDEAAYIPDLLEVLEGNVSPTLSTSAGPVVMGSTPSGVDTDYHHLWRRTSPAARFWGTSELNPKITAEYLERKRKGPPPMLETRYLQEYEAAFVDASGAMLRRSKVRYGTPPPLETFRTLSFGIDAAVTAKSSSDYSALAVCGIDAQDRRWLLHLAHWRSVWADTESKIVGFYRAWRPHVVAFESVSFAALGCRALLNAGVPCRPVVPHKDKAMRWERIIVRYHMGEVWHSDTLDQECENELFAFGFDKNGQALAAHDDCVDACELAFSPLFAELSDDWGGDQTSGRHWGKRLPHEIEPAKWYNSDGSYVQLTAGEDGKEQFTTFNANGTKKIDDGRRIQKIGDFAVLLDKDGNELDRCAWNAHVWGCALLPPPKSP